MVRGLHYMLERGYIEPPAHVDVFPLVEDVPDDNAQAMRAHGKVHAIGSAVVVNRLVHPPAPEPSVYSVYSIAIWSSQLELWATVSPTP
jgi:hypothetical protein